MGYFLRVFSFACAVAVASGLFLPDMIIGQDDVHANACDCAVCNDGTRQSRFYFRAETLFLDYGRRAMAQPAVIRNGEQGTNVELLSSDAATGIQFGPLVTFGIHRNAQTSWEFSYFGLFAGAGVAVANGDNDLALPGDLGLASVDLFNSNRMEVRSSGELHNFEINRLRHFDRWTLLTGFRYLRLTDSLLIESIDQGTDISEYSLEAENHLFGMQGGLQRSKRSGSWLWQVGGKAGVFGNSASQLQFVTDFPNPNPPFFLRAPVEQTQGQVAFIGEVDLGLAYEISPTLRVRAGYRLLWIEGVALAANQIDYRDVLVSEIRLSSAGGVFLHGATVGLEGTW